MGGQGDWGDNRYGTRTIAVRAVDNEPETSAVVSRPVAILPVEVFKDGFE